MSNLKKYILLVLLFQGGCVYSMNPDHIAENHLYRLDSNRNHIIKNDENGVMSELVGQYEVRKTIFPNNITRENLEENLMEIYCNGESLGITDYCVEFIRCRSTNMVVGMAKGMTQELKNTIVTAYPVLKYISLDDIENAANDSSIYIATVYSLNEITGKPEFKEVFSKISILKGMIRKSNNLASRQVDGCKVHINNISSFYWRTILTGMEKIRGSILLEVRDSDI